MTSSTAPILECMSARKLCYLVSALAAVWAGSLLAGITSPKPNNSMQFTATKCVDRAGDLESKEWFQPRGDHSCESIQDFDSQETLEMGLTADNIVFAFQMPHIRERIDFHYSRWQQILMGVMMMDIEYQSEYEQEPRVQLFIKARLGYRDRGETEWKELDEAVVHRNLDCDIDTKREGYYYNCSALSLFELGSLHHGQYLLNLRLPATFDASGSEVAIEGTEDGLKNNLGKLVDVHLVAIHQNGGFTKVWLALKTVFFPCVLLEVIWFWRRISQLPRSSTLLERTILALGLSLTLLNIPLEYLTLFVDMPWLTLVNDIKQGIFYATLMVFWLIFTGEHCINETGETGEKAGVSAYWKNLAVVAFGCSCLLVFDLWERGMQLRSCFESIWATDMGTDIALGCIILAGISAGTFFLFLCYRVYRVSMTLWQKQSAVSAMSSVRRLHYANLIWRFKFLIGATITTAAITSIGFILGRVAEGQYRWDEDIEVDASAAMMCGVYGLWNCYIFAMVFLYAPSHKNWPSKENNVDEQAAGEEYEMNDGGVVGAISDGGASELSSLTEFIQHRATD